MNNPHYPKIQHLTSNAQDDRYSGHLIHPSLPSPIGDEACIGREKELELIRIALGLNENWQVSQSEGLHTVGCQKIRIEGPSGVGKRSLVLEAARRTALPLYEMQGHADMSPEDLILAIVPRASESGQSNIPLVLQASPLATALLWGGIVYFDAIHRAPEKALAPLASLLDGRMALYSGLTGLQLKPRPDAAPFYFFCSCDPSETINLPAFFEQRSLPRLKLNPLEVSKKKELLGQLHPMDENELLEKVKLTKQKIITRQLKVEIEKTKALMQKSNLEASLKHIENGDIPEAVEGLKRLIAIETGAFPSEQQEKIQKFTIALQVFAADLLHRLRQEADKLAAKNDEIAAAKASPIYRMFLEIGDFRDYDRNNLAHCLMYEGKLEEALSEIEKALDERDHRYAVAWITRGEILERKKEIHQAIDCYARASEMESEYLSHGRNTREIAEAHLVRLAAKTNKNKSKE